MLEQKLYRGYEMGQEYAEAFEIVRCGLEL